MRIDQFDYFDSQDLKLVESYNFIGLCSRHRHKFLHTCSRKWIFERKTLGNYILVFTYPNGQADFLNVHLTHFYIENSLKYHKYPEMCKQCNTTWFFLISSLIAERQFKDLLTRLVYHPLTTILRYPRDFKGSGQQLCEEWSCYEGKNFS